MYRSRFLQPNTHFLAFCEIYKICTPSHRSKFKIFAKIRQTFSYFCSNFCKKSFFPSPLGRGSTTSKSLSLSRSVESVHRQAMVDHHWGKRQGARGKGQEARGQEARGKRQGARGKGQGARGKRQGALGKGGVRQAKEGLQRKLILSTS